MVTGQGSEVNKSFIRPTQSKAEATRHCHSLFVSIYLNPHTLVRLFDFEVLHQLVKSKWSYNLWSFNGSVVCPFPPNIVYKMAATDRLGKRTIQTPAGTTAFKSFHWTSLVRLFPSTTHIWGTKSKSLLPLQYARVHRHDDKSTK